MILARFLHCIPRHFVVTILYCIAFFLLGLNIASTGPLLIDLTKQVNVSIAEGGVFFSSRAAGYFLGSLGSSIIDRFPAQGNRLIAAGLFVAGGTTALVPLMTSLAAAGACFFFVGVSMGTLDCGANVMLLNEFAAKGIRVDPFMQALHAAFAVGAFISPLWMHFLTVTYNHAVALWSMAALFPFFALLTLLVLGAPTVRPPKPAAADDDNDADADARIAGSLAGTAGGDHDVAALERVRSSRAQARRRNWILQLSLVGLAALFLALYVGAEVGSGGYIDVYAQQHIGLSADDAAFLNAGYWGSFMAGRILAVFVATRVSPFTMMSSSLLMGCTALLLPMAFGATTATLWPAFILFGLAMAPCFPTTFTFCDLNVEMSARRAAALATGAALGEFVIPWATGEILTSTTLGAFPLVLEVVMVLATLAFVGMIVLARCLHPTGGRFGAKRAAPTVTANAELKKLGDIDNDDDDDDDDAAAAKSAVDLQQPDTTESNDQQSLLANAAPV
jgi:fucose permease